jgi:hypothetical protein
VTRNRFLNKGRSDSRDKPDGGTENELASTFKHSKDSGHPLSEDFPQLHTPNARKIPLEKRECKTKINKSLQLFLGVVLRHLHQGVLPRLRAPLRVQFF